MLYDSDGFCTSSIYCEHANENPTVCPCKDKCYCKRPGGMCGPPIKEHINHSERCHICYAAGLRDGEQKVIDYRVEYNKGDKAGYDRVRVYVIELRSDIAALKAKVRKLESWLSREQNRVVELEGIIETGRPKHTIPSPKIELVMGVYRSDETSIKVNDLILAKDVANLSPKKLDKLISEAIERYKIVESYKISVQEYPP